MGAEEEEEKAKKKADQEFRDRTNATGSTGGYDTKQSISARTERTGSVGGSIPGGGEALPKVGIPEADRNRIEKTERKSELQKSLREAVPDWVKKETGLKGAQGRSMAKQVRAFVRREGRLPVVTEMIIKSPETAAPDGTFIPQNTATATHPLKLITGSAAGKVRVVYGTIASQTPSGMSAGDVPPYEITVSGAGYFYAIVTIDGTTGSVTSSSIGNGAAVPANTATTFHYQIGSYSVDGTNISLGQSVFGSIVFLACRDWFAATAPFYAPNWGNI